MLKILKNPTFVPSDPNWFLAKIFFNNSDVNHHESISHLLNTHLMVEAFELITLRELDIYHPVYQILYLHFFFTSIINKAARKTLLAKIGVFATAFSIGYDGVGNLMQAAWKKHQFSDFNFVGDCIAKGYDPLNLPPSNELPYRAYAGSHWKKIHDFVNEFLGEFYKTPESVDLDNELQNWIKSIKANGNINVSDKPLTFAYLVDVVTTVIFNASVVHSAVNFSQARYFVFSPAFPTVLHRAPPSDRIIPPSSKIKEWGIDPLHQDSELNAQQSKYLMKILPSKLEAARAIAVVQTLSTPTDVSMGSFYEHHYSQVPLNLQAIAVKFLANWNNCEWRIQAVRIGYPFILPNTIAQSVSI